MAKKQNQAAPQDIEAVTKTEAFFDKYQKQILYGILAVIVIAAAWIGYVQLVRNPNIQKANEALAKCEALFNADNYDKALNGDGQGCMGFLKVADEFGYVTMNPVWNALKEFVQETEAGMEVCYDK